ncbi:hypothetical protein AB0I22_14920 [Streptomyces sp. NPDC050610]|uniref:hypothetical protein n=1 Tax=Streptomyces sp. NPDC050610 TaxID=3157097 RepID=UPI003422C26D
MRRSGLTVRFADSVAQSGSECGGEAAGSVGQSLSYVGRDGRAVGLGAVSAPVSEPVVARALAVWTSVMRTRRVVAAGTDSWCGGARRTLTAEDAALASAAGPLALLGGAALEPALERDGRTGRVLLTAVDVEAVPDGARVVIGPEGVPPATRAGLAARGVRPVDTGCPLIAAAQDEVRRFAATGETVIVVGRPGDAVAAGLVRQAPGAVRVVENEEDARRVRLADDARVAVGLQPGLPVEETERVAEAVRARFGHVLPQDPATYCHAAGDRIRALRGLAAACQVVLVVGPVRAARAAVAVLERAGTEAYVVGTAGDVRPQWLSGAGAVGVTAVSGVSPVAVSGLLEALSGLGPCAMRRQETSTTTMPAATGKYLTRVQAPEDSVCRAWSRRSITTPAPPPRSLPMALERCRGAS